MKERKRKLKMSQNQAPIFSFYLKCPELYIMSSPLNRSGVGQQTAQIASRSFKTP